MAMRHFQVDLTLAGANDWDDDEVTDFPGSPYPTGLESRFIWIPTIVWLSHAIDGTAEVEFFFAPGAAAAGEEHVREYISPNGPEQSALVHCGDGLPVPRFSTTTFDPWTLRVSSTGKSGDGIVKCIYTFRRADR